jgi:hypothetical protein
MPAFPAVSGIASCNLRRVAGAGKSLFVGALRDLPGGEREPRPSSSAKRNMTNCGGAGTAAPAAAKRPIRPRPPLDTRQNPDMVANLTGRKVL